MHHIQSEYKDLKAVIVRPIESEERDSWDCFMRDHHYLGFKHLVGESIRYVAIFNGQWVGLLGWCSGAYKCGPRDSWIGWDEQQRHARLKFVVNNSRFLIAPGINIPNLASRILSLNLKRLSLDWTNTYKHPVLLAETFVDHSRFSGTCYLAAGFTPLGQTKGFRRHNGYYYQHGETKTIMARPLCKNALSRLSDPFWTLNLFDNNHEYLITIDPSKIIGSGGLVDRLKKISDPRDLKGRSYSQSLILSIAVCACLAGARSFRDLGRWAAGLPPEILRSMGCKINEMKDCYIAPGEATMRRSLQAIDPQGLEETVGQWLSELGYPYAARIFADILRSLLDTRYIRIPKRRSIGGIE
jgi:hypothetical protein